MTSVDEFVLRTAGQFAGRHAFFDKVVTQFAMLPSVKLLPMFTLLIYLWFQSDHNVRAKKSCIDAILSAMSSLVTARLIQNLSPERLRPLHSGNPFYVPPIGTNLNALEDWSSFPSDTSSLVFAVSTAVFFFSRPLGVFLYIWSIVVVCLPRIYSGFHYLSDILGGAAIGVIAATLISFALHIRSITLGSLRLSERQPGIFYSMMFVLFFEFVIMFDGIRKSARGLHDFF